MDESHQPLRASLADRRADCERTSGLQFDAEKTAGQRRGGVKYLWRACVAGHEKYNRPVNALEDALEVY